MSPRFKNIDIGNIADKTHYYLFIDKIIINVS